MLKDIFPYQSIRKVDNNPALVSWYIMAKFLSGKQLNLMIGEIKNFVKYINDINSRAGKTICNREEIKALTEQYKNIEQVLAFALCNTGVVTNVLTDYFADENEYANYISQYVDLSKKDDERDIDALKRFGAKYGVYHNGTECIINRNVVNAKLYGSEKLLAKIFDSKSNKGKYLVQTDKVCERNMS